MSIEKKEKYIDKHKNMYILVFHYFTTFSFAHLGDGKTPALLTNVTDSHYHHLRQTGVLDRCTGPVYWTGVLDWTGVLAHQ